MKSLFQFWLILLLLLAGTISKAQDAIVYGVVKDAESGETMIGVNVSVDGSLGINTDLDGNYRITLEPGTYSLVYTFVGYKKLTKTVTVANNEVKQLSLKMRSASEELDIVVITASQYEKNIAEETVSTDVLDKELVQNTNSRDLGEVVDRTPGVQVIDGQISIRGGSSYSYGVGSRTAVLTDGLTNQSADLGEAQTKLTPVENVEQVEVIKGASSVVYGSSALNGVVNVRTSWPKGEPATSVSIYTGLYDKPKREELIWWDGYQPSFYGVFFNHSEKIKNLQLVLGANIDLVQSFLEDANEFRIRGNIKTRYVLPKKNGISFGLNANVLRETSGRFFLSQDLDTNAYRIEQGSEDRYIKTTVDPHFKIVTDNGHKYELNTRYLNVWRRGNGDDVNASSHSFSIDNQYQWMRKEFFVLTTGIPMNFGVSRSNLYTGTRINTSGAAYAQGEFRVKKRLSIVGGVRYELLKVDTVFDTSIPVFRSGLNVKAAKSTWVRMSMGQAFRMPSIGERFVSAELISNVGVVPNSKLDTEKGWSFETGVKQGFRIGKFKGFFDFSVFWQEFDRFVEYQIRSYTSVAPNGDGFYLDTLGNLYNDEDRLVVEAYADTGSRLIPGSDALVAIGFFPVNLDEARVGGYEASVLGKGMLGQVEIRTLFGYTYTYPVNLAEKDSTYGFTDYAGEFFSNMFTRIEPEPGENEVKGLLLLRSRHIFKFDIEAKYKGISLGLSAFYASFAERIPEEFKAAIGLIDGGKGTLEKYIEQHQGGDWIFNLRAGYEFNDKVRLGFLINNLANLEYAKRPGKLEAPRSYVLQLRIKLQ